MSLPRRLGLSDSYGLTAAGFILGILAAVIALVTIILFITLASSRAIGRTTCHNWSAQTGFKSKFVVLNFFSTGTCLAQAPNGQWVVNSQIVQFIGAKP